MFNWLHMWGWVTPEGHLGFDVRMKVLGPEKGKRKNTNMNMCPIVCKRGGGGCLVRMSTGRSVLCMGLGLGSQ